MSPIIEQSCNDTLPIDVIRNLMGRNLDNFDRLYTHSSDGHGLPDVCTNLSIVVASDLSSVSYTSLYYVNHLKSDGHSPLIPNFWMWFFLSIFTILVVSFVVKTIN